MKNLVRIGVAGVALAFAGGVLAQDKPAQADFSIVDQNRDGRVSKTEAQSNAELTSQFATLDADRDSYLSQSEYGKWKSGSAPVAPTPGAASESAKPPMSAPSTPAPAPQSSSESAAPAGEAR